MSGSPNAGGGRSAGRCHPGQSGRAATGVHIAGTHCIADRRCIGSDARFRTNKKDLLCRHRPHQQALASAASKAASTAASTAPSRATSAAASADAGTVGRRQDVLEFKRRVSVSPEDVGVESPELCSPTEQNVQRRFHESTSELGAKKACKERTSPEVGFHKPEDAAQKRWRAATRRSWRKRKHGRAKLRLPLPHAADTQSRSAKSRSAQPAPTVRQPKVADQPTPIPRQLS